MKRVEVFASVFCPYCHKAKALLKEHDIAFEWIEVPMLLGFKLPTRSFTEMKRRSGGETTVPQIFVDGEYYGDEDTFVEDERSGKLGTKFGI